MPNYRDDETSGAVASEVYTSRLGMWLQDTARAVATVVIATSFTFSDSATAKDAMTDGSLLRSSDTATVSETYLTLAALRQNITDTGSAKDSLAVFQRTQVTDGAIAGDAITGLVTSRLTDSATASDTLTHAKRSMRQIAETATASDLVTTITRQQVSEAASASDIAVSFSTIRIRITDTAMAQDSLSETSLQSATMTERATASDSLWQHLSASTRWTDSAYASDELSGVGVGGAWTANVDKFATSRYYPYDFTSLAVINGTLYGTCPRGVFRLDDPASTEIIKTQLVTPSLDLSTGALVIPRSVYLAYACDGEVAMNVATEQSGQAIDFDYTLPAELADTTTTGRITLGRGLRGRYYRFTLRTEGVRFNAAEMRVALDELKRKI
ncbi:hypothetical protein [Propionivibrio sp.]|uniref:hypothetical protein n=1 Tax=Propionivibrio sp. TaxID=2212460 RepID=UPI003BEFC85A